MNNLLKKSCIYFFLLYGMCAYATSFNHKALDDFDVIFVSESEESIGKGEVVFFKAMEGLKPKEERVLDSALKTSKKELPQSPSDCVDINRASHSKLIEFKGLGEKTVRLILEERALGDFLDERDFIARIKGVGVKKVDRLKKQGLCFPKEQHSEWGSKNINANHSQKRSIKSKEYSKPKVIFKHKKPHFF